MSISPLIRDVFGHFQNLNLLALLHDLRDDRTARQAWSSGSLLCPVAHGLSGGAEVRRLSVLGQIAELGQGCDRAARQLGAEPAAVLRFVRSWDAESLSRTWLLGQLQEMWEERRADAEAVQEVLEGEGLIREAGSGGADATPTRPQARPTSLRSDAE